MVVGLVTVNFTFSPGVRSMPEGSKKKSSVATVISLTSDPEDGEVGVGVAAGRDVGVGVGVGVSEEPHAAATRPMVARRAIAKICFDNLTPNNRWSRNYTRDPSKGPPLGNSVGT